MYRDARDSSESRMDRKSWAVLAFVILVLLLSLIQTIDRLRLPWDGWSLARDATGSGERLVYYQNLVAGSSALQPGDVLLSVQGQPFEEILRRALTVSPQRPPNWKAGGTVYYTVLRSGKQEFAAVWLVHLTPLQIANSILRNWLINPSLLPALLIGFFVFARRPRNLAAQLLLVLTACYFASDGIAKSIGGSNVMGLAELFYPQAYWPSQFFANLLWSFIIGPVYAHLFLAFPVTKRPLLQFPRFTLIALYGSAPLAFLGALLAFRDPIEFWNAWSAFNLVELVLIIGIAIASAAHSLLTTREYAMRAQIRWIAAGTVITSLGALSGVVMSSIGLAGKSWLLELIAFRGLFLAFPIAVGVAILRYRLFDIDVIIRRTVIYGALSSVLALTYVSLVFLLQQYFHELTGEQQSGIAAAISTLIIAALFVPLREWMQKAIDRRFYRSKYDAAQTLSTFAAKLRDEVELDKLTEDVIRVIEDTMQPSSVTLWLNRPADERSAE